MRAPPPSYLLRTAVELAFDGNHTDCVFAWVYPRNPSSSKISAKDLQQLADEMAEGNLSWVCIPPAGFRL